MALDPSIFLQGAALQQRNSEQFLNTLQNAQLMAMKRQEMNSLNLEQQVQKDVLNYANGGQLDDAAKGRITAWSLLKGGGTEYKPDEFGNVRAITKPTLADQIFGGMAQTAKPQGDLVNRVMMAESGGNPDAVSPKGAYGLMQIMPETGQSPGFGIEPLKDNSPQENMRLGADYLKAMGERYGGIKELQLMAYNWGPGNVDKWLANGANPAEIPEETSNYVKKILGKDIVTKSPNNAYVAQTPKGMVKAFETDEDIRKEQAKKSIEVDAKLEETRPKAEASIRDLNAKVLNMEETLDQAIKDVGAFSAGFIGQKTMDVGGTPAANLKAILDTVKADAAFSELQKMRDNSPTGGALGSTTEKELDLLASAQAALAQTQSPERLKENLEKYKRIRRQSLERVSKAFEDTYGYKPQGLGGDNESWATTQSGVKYRVVQ